MLPSSDASAPAGQAVQGDIPASGRSGMVKRRALIITYEFPPSGGGGVQRWAKMCRYLPEHGWEPIVVCAEPVHGRSRDESLLGDVSGVKVTRIPGRHVSGAIARLLAPFKGMRRQIDAGPGQVSVVGTRSAGIRMPLSGRISRFIAVPDDAAYWRAPAVRSAVRVGRDNAVDLVIASGPPFSAMVAGAEVAERLGVPLVVDQRDSWRDNPALKMPTALHRRQSLDMQRRTVRAAALVVGTAPGIVDEASGLGARRTAFVPNGFDPVDLPVRVGGVQGPLKLVFMGKVYSGQTDPAPLLRAMAAVAKGGGPAAEVRFELIGAWPDATERLVNDLGLSDRVTFVPYLPHRQALERVARADVGVTLQASGLGAEGSCPAKLFEYLGMGMPALVIGPTVGLATRVLSEAAGGWQVESSDETRLAQLIRDIAELKAAGEALPKPDSAAVAKYDRSHLAGVFAKLLDDVLEGAG